VVVVVVVSLAWLTPSSADQYQDFFITVAWQSATPSSENHRTSAATTSCVWVTVRSCPPPSIVISSDDGMSACIRGAYLYGTVLSVVPCKYTDSEKRKRGPKMGSTYMQQQHVSSSECLERALLATDGTVSQGRCDCCIVSSEMRGLKADNLKKSSYLAENDRGPGMEEKKHTSRSGSEVRPFDELARCWRYRCFCEVLLSVMWWFRRRKEKYHRGKLGRTFQMSAVTKREKQERKHGDTYNNAPKARFMIMEKFGGDSLGMGSYQRKLAQVAKP